MHTKLPENSQCCCRCLPALCYLLFSLQTQFGFKHVPKGSLPFGAFCRNDTCAPLVRCAFPAPFTGSQVIFSILSFSCSQKPRMLKYLFRGLCALKCRREEVSNLHEVLHFSSRFDSETVTFKWNCCLKRDVYVCLFLFQIYDFTRVKARELRSVCFFHLKHSCV